MDQMVDVTIDGDRFASLRIGSDPEQTPPGPNAYVAQAQAELAQRGYVLDNEATYEVRDPRPGERTHYVLENDAG